jgi:pilus assembly protein CpaF
MELKALTKTIIEAVSKSIQFDLKSYQDWDRQIVTKKIDELAPNNKARLEEEFLGCGPLSKLLENDAITEILVNGPEEIWIETHGRLEKTEDIFLSEQTYRSFFIRLFQEIGAEATINSPFVDGEWKGNRVHIVAPPSSACLTLSLRKHPNESWTFDRLSQMGWADVTSLQALKNLVTQRKNMIFVGPTGSGKTSALNACLNYTEKDERIVILEDTQELHVPHSSGLRLRTRNDSKKILEPITLQDLVKQSLRMRPDRLILGEVRGPEAKDLLQALSTGHSGSMCTLHASSPQEALIRLEMLIQLGAPQWDLAAVRRLIFLSLNYVVVLKKNADGKRVLEGIYKLSSVESFGITLERVNDQAAFLRVERTAPR